MTLSTRQINALLASRICHDVISPLSAIGNGVELLAMSGMGNSPELALISESVQNASGRVRFMRVAFGAAAANQRLSPREVNDILASIGRPRRLEIEWRPEMELSRTEVKLAFLLLQCVETAMPRGGEIVVAFDDGWSFEASAPKVRHDAAYWRLLTDPEAEPEVEITSALVHFAIARDMADMIGRPIEAEIGAEGITLRC